MHKPKKGVHLQHKTVSNNIMNVAKRALAYYDSDDFKGMYLDCLIESYMNDEADIINRILNLFNVSNYETEKELSNFRTINREEAAAIFAIIHENIEEFTSDFRSYRVGPTSLASVSFGEQEEQLTGRHNNRTGKEYTLRYMKQAFSDEGYYISDNDCAYMDLSGEGLHIDLLGNIETINNFLKQ